MKYHLQKLCSKNVIDTIWPAHFPYGDPEYSQPLTVPLEKCPPTPPPPQWEKQSLFCEVKKIAVLTFLFFL